MMAHMDPPGRVLPSHRLMGGCATGYFHDWIDYNGVTLHWLPTIK